MRTRLQQAQPRLVRLAFLCICHVRWLSVSASAGALVSCPPACAWGKNARLHPVLYCTSCNIAMKLKERGHVDACNSASACSLRRLREVRKLLFGHGEVHSALCQLSLVFGLLLDVLEALDLELLPAHHP